MESQGSSFPELSSNEMSGFFKRMLDNLFDAVYFTDLQRRIIYWNLAAEDLTGYSAEEVAGEMLCRQHPDARR
jgi:PAS domain S-box-containing protein